MNCEIKKVIDTRVRKQMILVGYNTFLKDSTRVITVTLKAYHTEYCLVEILLEVEDLSSRDEIAEDTQTE